MLDKLLRKQLYEIAMAANFCPVKELTFLGMFQYKRWTVLSGFCCRRVCQLGNLGLGYWRPNPLKRKEGKVGRGRSASLPRSGYHCFSTFEQRWNIVFFLFSFLSLRNSDFTSGAYGNNWIILLQYLSLCLIMFFKKPVSLSQTQLSHNWFSRASHFTPRLNH